MFKCYTARAEGQEEGTLIIARNGSQAADIFVVDYMSTHGDPPGAFTVALNDLRRMPLLEDLRALMRGHVGGVVEFDEEHGNVLKSMTG